MNIGTGQTIYENILSFDYDNNPVTGATFDTAVYQDGVINTRITVDVSLTDGERGVFIASWSASTYGIYQMYAKNNITSVIFISGEVQVKSDSELNTTVYVGL